MLSVQDLTRCRIKITYLQISCDETLFGLSFAKKKKKPYYSDMFALVCDDLGSVTQRQLYCM